MAIAEKYKVVRQLYEDALGVVFLCRHLELSGTLVSVRVFSKSLASEKTQQAKIRSAILAAYSVRHQNVLTAYEYLALPIANQTILTTEYVEGSRLSDLLETGPLPAIADIKGWLIQSLSGLEAIHEAGILHGALSPEQILIATDGTVKLMNFGLVSLAGSPTSSAGDFLAIEHIPPEYVGGGAYDQRFDIYALGLTFYEALTGDFPFKGGSILETMAQRQMGLLPPPCELRRDCPEPLSTIVLKAAARNPEHRYSTAAEMRHAVEKLA